MTPTTEPKAPPLTTFSRRKHGSPFRDPAPPPHLCEVPHMVEFLKASREDLGMTRNALADEVGVSAAALGSWEHGKGRISAEHLSRMARALGCELWLVAPQD